MGRSAPAGQRTFPRGSDVTRCCCPHDVAQVLGQSAGRARRVLGQVEEVSKSVTNTPGLYREVPAPLVLPPTENG